MKQETTNTFDQGLNKDLNPIVTPNNVLTDSLNGTFITFNGDELSLQNDSGNTTIKPYWNPELYIEWTPETTAVDKNGKIIYVGEGDNRVKKTIPAIYEKGAEVKITKQETGLTTYYKSLVQDNEAIPTNASSWEVQDRTVKLSEGFYPLGIKEYGGVLYIVSGKKGSSSKGEDDLIEFGSYPAPKFGNYSTEDGELLSFTDKDSLYKSRTLNTLFFKSGGYINFSNQGELDLTNVTTPDNQRMYNIMLLHQLDSGTFNLTNDIWEKYTEYKKTHPTEPAHWISSKDFNYFCPSQFKGKLVLRIELDEPKSFEFAELPSIETINSKFRMSFRMDWKDSDSIKILGYNMRLTYSTGKQVTLEPVMLPEAKEIKTITLDKEKIVSFEVTPVFQTYTLADLPDELVDKYTLTGSILLEEKYLSMYFGLAGGECDIEKGMKTYKELILSNNQGPLGLDLEVLADNEKKIVFLEQGKYPTQDANQLIVGRFKVIEEKAVLTKWESKYEEIFLALENGEEIVSTITNRIGDTVVSKSDPTCFRFNIKVKFNIALPMENTMTAENDGVQFFLAGEDIPLDFVSYDGRTFEMEVQQFKDLYIRVNSSFSNYENRSSGRPVGGTVGMGSTIVHTTYVPDKTYDIALVTQIDHNYGLPGDIAKRTFYTDAISIAHKNLMMDLFDKEGNVTYTPGITGANPFEVDYQIRDNEIRWILNFNTDSRSATGAYGGLKALSVGDNEYINIQDVRSVKYHKFGNEKQGFIITQSFIKSERD